MLRKYVLVETVVLLEPGQEGNAVLVQFLYVLLGEVPGIEDCKLGLDPVRLQLKDGFCQGVDVDDVSRTVAHEQGKLGLLLQDIDEPHLVADLPVVVADGCKGEMDAVGQACAVDEDIGPFLLPGKELRIFPEEVPIYTLIPYEAQHITDPLAAEIGIRVEDPRIVAFPPGTGMAIGKVAQDIVLDHGVHRIGIAIAKGLDTRLKTVLADEGVKEVGVPEVKDEPFLCTPPGYLGNIGRVRLAVGIGSHIIGEDSPLPVSEDPPLLVKDPSQASLAADYLVPLPSGRADLGVLHTVLDVISKVHTVPCLLL